MDIKGILNAITPLQTPKGKNGVERMIKSDSATDRDANGQSPQDQQKKEQPRPPLTEEQFTKACENLRAHPIIKENSFTVEKSVVADQKYLILKDFGGRVIREIPESDLWNILENPTSDRGQVLSKTA